MELLENLGKIAGIAGISIGALVYIFRSVIRRSIFPTLSPIHGYRIIRLIIILTFSIAFVGLLTFLISKNLDQHINNAKDSEKRDTVAKIPSDTLKRDTVAKIPSDTLKKDTSERIPPPPRPIDRLKFVEELTPILNAKLREKLQSFSENLKNLYREHYSNGKSIEALFKDKRKESKILMAYIISQPERNDCSEKKYLFYTYQYLDNYAAYIFYCNAFHQLLIDGCIKSDEEKSMVYQFFALMKKEYPDSELMNEKIREYEKVSNLKLD
ncbi:hypothetical protein [Runella sp. SP2]|uniref:hypothetical protein n=1 Tax=Runella sp. SP2 TaxID=2268026 RepID=UPI000F07E773|nr:hypothetical protein [Runella sp. SP2]AYQ36656.1 hypothetical protein DTQ70_30495 [Runella sp. SP2]